jgi:hypothetical protein
VVYALDAVERLPCFAPNHVKWNDFRFYGAGAGHQMDMVAIYAYPTDSGRSGFVRFAVARQGFTVTDPQHRRLTVGDVARTLGVPTASAEIAVTALRAALATALARFNAAHCPSTIARTLSTREQAPGSYTRRAGTADHGPRFGIGL